MSIDRNEDSLRTTMEKDFGLDPEKGFAYKLEVGKNAKAWNIAKVQCDVKMKADAAARAHGVPISLLEPDWASLMNAFKNKYGSHIPSKCFASPVFCSSRSKRCSQTGPLRRSLWHMSSARRSKKTKTKQGQSHRDRWGCIWMAR